MIYILNTIPKIGPNFAEVIKQILSVYFLKPFLHYSIILLKNIYFKKNLN